MKICKVEGCDNKRYDKRFCNRHYQQIRLYGKILKRTIKDKNNIRIKEDVCYMDLYNIKCKRIATTIFNKKHLQKVKKIKWCLSLGYVRGRKNGRSLFLHGLIINGETTKGGVIDHIDRNKLNNLDDNLRIVTVQQNAINNNSKGYSWNNFKGKWCVRLMINSKEKSFGCFKTEEEAIKKAYEAREQRYLDVFR